jgi:hypothetical protein
MMTMPLVRSSIAVLVAGCGLVAPPATPPAPTAETSAPPAAAAAGKEATPAPKTALQAAPKAAEPAKAPEPSKAAAPAKAPSKAAAPAAPAPAAAAAAAPPQAAARSAAAPPLDLKSLEQRLKETNAIGVLTKLSLKNQVDDLVAHFRAFHAGQRPPTLTELRPAFEMLLMKVLSLLQDHDAKLANEINQSRDAIWGVLTDRDKLSQYL